MTGPPFDPEQGDLPPDGATWTGELPFLPDGPQLPPWTWTFRFPFWSAPGGRLVARAFDPAGLDITRRWAADQA